MQAGCRPSQDQPRTTDSFRKSIDASQFSHGAAGWIEGVRALHYRTRWEWKNGRRICAAHHVGWGWGWGQRGSGILDSLRAANCSRAGRGFQHMHVGHSLPACWTVCTVETGLVLISLSGKSLGKRNYCKGFGGW